MLEKFLTLLERLVVAVEKIGELYVRTDGMVSGDPELSPEEENAFGTETELPSGEQMVVTPENVPVPPDTIATSDVELDKENFPWDERINASTKTKVKKTGIWKLLRGVDEALVTSVRAELTSCGYGVNYKGVSNTTPASPSHPVTPPAPPAVPPSHPVTPPAPPVEQPTNSVVPTGELSFPDFVTAVTAAGYTVATIQPFLDKHGIANLPGLANDLGVMKVIASEMGVWNG